MNQLLKYTTSRGNENSKVVALAKNSDRLNQQQPRARFAQQTPRSKRFEIQIRLQVYQRARYYDCVTGEFTRRDPLEYVDGMSLYRAYFVPVSVDPDGLLQQGILRKPACEAAKRMASKDPKYISIMKVLKSEGCKIPEIYCKNLSGIGGQYDPSTGDIEIDYSSHPSKQEIVHTILHELIHALDDCSQMKYSCEGWACTEIRANSFSGQCENPKGETREDCIKNAATFSINHINALCLVRNPKLIDEMYPKCFICSCCSGKSLPPKWPGPLRPNWIKILTLPLYSPTEILFMD